MAIGSHKVIVELIAKAQGNAFKQVGADAAALEAKVGSASRGASGSLAALGASGKTMGLALGAGAAIGVLALTKFATKSADAFLGLASSVRDFQRTTGSTAEDASKLVFALKRVGTEPEVAGKAFFQLSKRIGAGQVDLARFGIEIKRNQDGSINMKDAVLQLSGALGKLDANKRAAAVFELFGRQGAALLPILGKTRTELEEIFKLAGKDHQILSQKDIDRSVAYKKSLAELNLAMQGLEVQVGRAVVPVLEELTKVVTPLAGFISDNAAAFVFLGKVVGGPLVAGLAAFTAIKIGSWAVSGIRSLLGFGSAIGALVTRLAGGTIAMQGFAATSEATAATVTASAGGMTAGLGAIVAGVSGLMTTLASINPSSSAALLESLLPKSFRESPVEREFAALEKSEKKLLNSGLKNATAHGNAYDYLKNKIAETSALAEKAQKKYDNREIRGGLSLLGDLFRTNQNDAERAGDAAQKYSTRLDLLKKAIKPFEQGMKAAGLEVNKTTIAMGDLKVPSSLVTSLDGKGLKKFATDLQGTQSTFGFFATQMLLNSGISQVALQELTKSADATDKAIVSSFTNATSVIGSFGDQTEISGDEFIGKLQEMNTQAHAFADELKLAAEQGVDQGLLKSIAEAGPKAEPELRALLEAVKNNGVGAINQTQADTNAVLDKIRGTIKGRIGGDAAAAGEYGRAVGYALGTNLVNTASIYISATLNKIRAAFGGGGGGPKPGNFGLPELAAGGPVKRNQPYIVGEAGAELFVPDSAGRILSNKDSMSKLSQLSVPTNGGSSSPVYNVTVNSLVADANTGRQVARALAAYQRNGGQ